MLYSNQFYFNLIYTSNEVKPVEPNPPLPRMVVDKSLSDSTMTILNDSSVGVQI